MDYETQTKKWEIKLTGMKKIKMDKMCTEDNTELL